MDPNLGIIAKVSSLPEILRLSGSNALVYLLWAQFTLTAVRVSVEVTWSYDDVLVSISTCSILSTYHVWIRFVACLVQQSQWDTATDFVSLHQLGKIRRSCSVEFEEQGLRTWDKNVLRRVCVATLDRYSDDPYQNVSTLCHLIDGPRPDVSVVSISGGSYTFVEAFCDYQGSGYHQNMIDYPSFDLRLFKRRLQRTASTVIGSLDGFALTEFIVNWLKGVETRDWMLSRPEL